MTVKMHFVDEYQTQPGAVEVVVYTNSEGDTKARVSYVSTAEQGVGFHPSVEMEVNDAYRVAAQMCADMGQDAFYIVDRERCEQAKAA